MKRRIFIIIASVLTLIFALSSIALAQIAPPENEIMASSHLTAYSVTITAEENKQLKIGFDVIAKNIMDDVGAWQIKVEKNSGSGWVSDRTLSYKDYDNFLKQNTAKNKSSITITGTANVQYRAVLTAYAKDASGSDSKTATSNTATCY